MKRFFALTFVCMALCAMQAQNVDSGSLRELAEAGVASFEIDYSEAHIHSMTEAEFALYEEDWDKDQKYIIAEFLDNLNDRTGDQLVVVKGKKTDLTLRWVVLHIDPRGNIISELHVVNKEGKVLAKITELRGAGGRFGTKLNLIKDGARSSGKRAGSFLKRELMKYQKD